MEGLVGSLAPDTGGLQARADEVADAIADFCLAAVSGSGAIQTGQRREGVAPAPLRRKPFA